MFLKIKNIPKVSWSSKKPYNFKPKFSTFFFLCFGLALFGLGEGLLIVSFTGASPWSVLAQGISLNVNLSIGTITLLVSIAVLILWIPLGQRPGMGTIFNAFILEVILTFFLANSVLIAAVSKKAGPLAGNVIGFTLIACIMVGGPLTGAGLNPARSFGPALVSGNLEFIWLYILAPLTGAFIASKIYKKLI